MNSFFSRAVLLLLTLGFVTLGSVMAEEGLNAYNFILLTDIDRNRELFDAFYNRSSGVELRLTPNSYRSLTPKGSPEDFRARHIHHFMENASSYTVSLSEEYTVLEKPLCASKDGQNHTPLLLHCRLPLLLTTAQLEARRERFLEEYLTPMKDKLEHKWRELAKGTDSFCFYGNGEDPYTGKGEYYILCPHGPILHFRKEPFLERYTNGTWTEKNEELVLRKMEAFVKRVIQSPLTLQDFMGNPRWGHLYRVIGEYSVTESEVMYDRTQNTWKLIYPSSHYCPQSYLFSNGRTNSPPPKWQSIVEFRCLRSQREDSVVWSFTEERQLCRYRIDIGLKEICDWEGQWEDLHVTPIPCVTLE